MKPKFLLALALAAVLGASPAVSYADFNDVTLTSDTVITATTETLNVSGASAVLQSISVSGDVITVAMAGNSYLKVTSSGRHTLSAPNKGSIVQTSSCTDSLATDIFQAPAAITSVFTFDITVDSGTCTTGTNNSTSGNTGGGGGGGGGSYTYVPPAPAATPISTPLAATVAAAAPSAGASSSIGTVTLALTKGTTNAEVKILQMILNSDPDTRIAATGSGSPGHESTFFGSATRKAVQKLQVKYGIAKRGDSGYGSVGPLTRTILNGLASKIGNPDQQVEDAMKQIKVLQDQMKAQ